MSIGVKIDFFARQMFVVFSDHVQFKVIDSVHGCCIVLMLLEMSSFSKTVIMVSDHAEYSGEENIQP